EVRIWRQSNALMREKRSGRSEAARRTLLLRETLWWYNMYSAAGVGVPCRTRTLDLMHFTDCSNVAGSHPPSTTVDLHRESKLTPSSGRSTWRGSMSSRAHSSPESSPAT